MSVSAFPPARGAAADRNPVACFSVHARPGPSLMPRVAAVFARHGLAPDRWYAALQGDEFHVDVQVPGLDGGTVDLLAGALRALIEVDCVLVSEKRLAAAA